MTDDREEIRWKFQVLSDSMNTALQINENERKILEQSLEKISKETRGIRNTFIGIIGFTIGLIVSLVSMDAIEKNYLWGIVAGFILALIIFVGSNMYIYKWGDKANSINVKYTQIQSDLIKLKGDTSASALDENITHDQVKLVINFIFVMGQVIGYETGLFSHNILKTPKPEQENYRSAYEMAKEKLDEFRKLVDAKYITRVELFIHVFEKNEPKKDDSES